MAGAVFVTVFAEIDADDVIESDTDVVEEPETETDSETETVADSETVPELDSVPVADPTVGVFVGVVDAYCTGLVKMVLPNKQTTKRAATRTQGRTAS